MMTRVDDKDDGPDLSDDDAVGDPDAVSPELGRFLDWLAAEAIKEAFADE